MRGHLLKSRARYRELASKKIQSLDFQKARAFA
jgi:hypothetical protein